MRSVYIYEHAGSRSIGSNLSSSEQTELFARIRSVCTELYDNNRNTKIYVHKQHTVKYLVSIIKEFAKDKFGQYNSLNIVCTLQNGDKVPTPVDDIEVDLTSNTVIEFYIVGNLKNDRFPFSQIKLHSTEAEALAYAQSRFETKPHNTYYVLKTVAVVHPTQPQSNVTRFPIAKSKRKNELKSK